MVSSIGEPRVGEGSSESARSWAAADLRVGGVDALGAGGGGVEEVGTDEKGDGDVRAELS